MLFTVDIEDFVFVQTEISLQPWSGGWNAVERPRGAMTGRGLGPDRKDYWEERI